MHSVAVAVMRVPGMDIEEIARSEVATHQRYVRELWPIFEDFAKNRDGSRYLNFFPDGEPFADWAHQDRYVHRERFSQVTVGPHREAAQRVRLMVGFGTQDEEP